MTQAVSHKVDVVDDGATVYFVLRERMGVSEAIVRHARRLDRGVELDGAPCRTDAVVRTGQVVTLSLFDSGRETSIEAEPGEMHVVFEDEHLLVLDKPAGLVVHPSRGHFSGTLCNFVAHYLRESGRGEGAHPVNRLDRDTSGLIVFAKHAHAQNLLADQLHTGAFERTYLAVCEGAFDQDAGLVDAPIARLRDEYGSFGVSEEGKPAVTHYRVLGRVPRPMGDGCGPHQLDGAGGPCSSGGGCGLRTPGDERDLSVVQLQLETGRTHQIRVHMAHLGHPLLGDDAYGSASSLIARCALHSWKLALDHPITRERLALSAPVPPDMEALVCKMPRLVGVETASGE